MPRLTATDLHGEIQLIKKDIEFLRDSQIKVQHDIAEIKQTLLNPDDGAIARVNKNTEFRKVAVAALWSIWITMLGVLAKIIFWD